MTQPGTDILPLLNRVKAKGEAAGVFGGCEVRGNRLVCRAANSAAPASYRVELDGGRVWVSLVMADRWLSESIESHLVDHGDRLEDLLEEELAELDYHGPKVTFEHYRSEDRLFTFRTPAPVALEKAGTEEAAEVTAKLLLGYEACFRQLGDMDAGEDGE
jgi:hypothetical protein